MTNEREQNHEHNHTKRTLSVSKLVLVGFLIIAGYFLFMEHRAHLGGVLYYLPFIFLLACPLMHIFMHGGHGGHGGHDHDNRDSDNKKGGA